MPILINQYKGLIMTEVLGLGIFITATVAITASESTEMPLIQYGALGLCAFMVFWLLKHLNEQTKTIREDSIELKKLTYQAIKALDRIATLWEERACLLNTKPVNTEILKKDD